MSETARGSVALVRRRAILCVLGSSGSFAVAAALVKTVAAEVPVIELVLFRSAIALLFVVPLIVQGGGWTVFRTRQPFGHLVRGLAGLAGMFTTFYGLAHLPIAAVTALGFAMPLFLAVLSIPLLGERLTAGRAISVGAGLVGVLLVIRPWQGSKGLPLFESAVVVGGVVGWALAMVSIRRMGRSGESNLTIVALFSLLCTLVSSLAAVPGWTSPRLELWPALLGIGVLSGAAQLLMTEGYRSGEASMLAPFEYSAILYTLALGFVVWGERPGVWDGIGIGVLVAAGLLTWWREARR